MAYSPSEKYPGAVDVDPDYQGGKFRDNNPSTTNNGSPLKAIDRNELLARDEAIMNDAGFEYSGLPDTPQDSQLFKAYKASLGNGANLLSNHNFLTQRAGHTQPPPSSTPTSYPPGYELFQGVFANETTGITNLTYIDDRVSFSGGDLYFAVPNTGAIARLTSDQLTASVANFDGKPRTRGVSFALVGDEYRVTVGIDALEDAGATLTPLGSVKFEQGSVATGHAVQTAKGQPYTFNTVDEMKSNGAPVGSKVQWLGYYEVSDGGSNWGIVKSGAHTENGGAIFSINFNTYIEANAPLIAEQWGVLPSSSGGKVDVSDRFNAAHSYLKDSSTLTFLGSKDDAYYMNVDNSKLQLSRNGRVAIRPFSNTTLGGFAMRLGAHTYLSTWNYYVIDGLDFITEVGFNALDMGAVSTPELAGRWVLRNTHIGGEGTKGEFGFRKLNGNIGNSFLDTTFRNTDFGYYAEGAGPSVMHVGADTINRSHFESIDKSAIYIDGKGVDGVYMPDIDCIIEGCGGFGLFIKDISSNVPFANKPIMANLENNAQSPTVNIGGTDYTPREIRLENCHGIVMQGMYLYDMELINSSVYADFCRFDSSFKTPTFTFDNESSVTGRNAYLNGSVDPSIMIESIFEQTEGSFSSMRMPLKTTADYSGGAIVQPYVTAQSLSGTTTLNGVVVNTGIIQKECNSYVLPVAAGTTLVGNETFNVTADRWYVWSIMFRVSVGSFTFSMNDVVDLGSIGVNRDNWSCYSGILKARSSGTVRSRYTNFTDDGTTWEQQGLQLVEFTRKQDAFDYINSRAVKWS